MPTPVFYVLRYLPGVDLRDRLHSHTEGRYETWLDAEEARAEVPKPWTDLLEVVSRG